MTSDNAPAASEAGPGSQIALDVEVRPLTTHEELRACVELQRLTWGDEYTDIVPASLLKASTKVGGLIAGAFTPDQTLVGFVYGLTGIDSGKPVHWSHMLAVRKEARSHGVARRLKRFQQRWVQERGVAEMRWTFDPLVARNAHFNLNVLGVRVVEYVPDMYPDTGSPLHSFGMDRFIVLWQTGTEGDERADLHDEDTAMPEVFSFDREGEPPLPGTSFPDAPAVRLRVPPDVEALGEVCPEEAGVWRRVTRSAFLHYQERGYQVAGFRLGNDGNFYLLRAGG